MVAGPPTRGHPRGVGVDRVGGSLLGYRNLPRALVIGIGPIILCQSQCMYVCMYICMYVCMMQGCHTPLPPHPMVSPVACQVGSCLVWPCCFPRLVLFGLVHSRPCGVAPVVFLVGPAPPVGGSVFYRGMVWLLPLVGSNVIVTCLVPSPPVDWGLW